MSSKKVRKFQEEREKLNRIVLEQADLSMKRFFHLDAQTYQDGALPRRIKEMLGLAASMVLRCDDCVMYHLIRCKEEEITDEELREILSVALIVGGSITIPHVRKAFQAWEEMKDRG